MPDNTPDMASIPSPGQLLKQKRRENGLAIEDIADHLLLSVAQVRALEADQYEKLPGATYIMGYWRSYAGLLKIDASRSIELYKDQLDTTSSAIALERNHQRAHGHQEKSRKKSALLFFLLSALFLTGIWYWQNPDDNPVNQWIENLSSRQLIVRNTGTQSIESEIDEEDNTFEFIPETSEQSVITLPEPNFSEELETGEKQVSLSAEIGHGTKQNQVVKPVDDQESLTTIVVSMGEQEQILEQSSDQAIESMPTESGISAPEETLKTEIVTESSESASLQDSSNSMVFTEPSIETAKVIESVVEEPVVEVEATKSGSLPIVESSEEVTAESTEAEIVDEEAGASDTISTPDSVVEDPNYEPGSPKWISIAVENQTWLDIRDSNAEKLIYRTANAGESIQLKGRPPFYIYIGAVDGVQVDYMGKNVEFQPDANSQFSRFKLGSLE